MVEIIVVATVAFVVGGAVSIHEEVVFVGVFSSVSVPEGRGTVVTAILIW